jgi:hypothetical protein
MSAMGQLLWRTGREVSYGANEISHTAKPKEVVKKIIELSVRVRRGLFGVYIRYQLTNYGSTLSPFEASVKFCQDGVTGAE